jgi:hypothetical protein
MKEKLAVVYDTANVIGRIRDGEIEEKHVLSPLLVPSAAGLAVAILPVVKKDLTINGWGDVLENIRSIVENKMRSFDLYITEEEFLYNDLDNVYQALKTIEILNDAGEIARAQLTGFYRCFILIDHNPKIHHDKEIEEVLNQLVRGIRECRSASPDEVIEDARMYLLPYLDLLREGKFAILLVTDDACFRGLASAYSARRGLDVGAVEVRLLADVRRLAGRLSEALRSSSSDSR